MSVQVLFTDPEGPYPWWLNEESCWGEARDARLYAGPDPVVAHPPCHLWGNLSRVNYKRYKDRSPEHEARLRPGNDQGCFAAALASVRRYGGVLEHPARSYAWEAHGLRAPPRCPARSPLTGRGWHELPLGRGWVCEVWQSAYGHPCAKATWLLYIGRRRPPELDWRRLPGTHQIGWFDRNKPTLGKKLASRTPLGFAEQLIQLAEWSTGA